ncbi:DUF1501 domain-containing protein [Thioclava sp. SK-1]|uniref:DUF1501 domain-containing protein n=1 Tax=Thioclava sp. SK-1 TaxID=1889770 RepID=UPI0021014933|nr:DUF1501 domain-containing protein [Thioclava sp. SK-1]
MAGCSMAAHPLMSSVTLADTPGENRLAVIILRGAMDGLDLIQPYGDPQLALYRPKFDIGPNAGAADLDGFFALHPAMAELLPLWHAGELGFAHAVSTPYRGQRSHFDGQDILEAGTGLDVPDPMRQDGWLNRLLQTMPGTHAETAFSIGTADLPVLTGAAPSTAWTPDTWLNMSDQGRRLLDQIYHDDPLFRDAAQEALSLTQGERPAAYAAQKGKTAASESLAAFAAQKMRGSTRIAAFSLSGWDTHVNQRLAMAGPVAQLAAMIRVMKSELGPVWARTSVLALTEFGRTAAQNGSGGTDHGTGGVAVMAGGALRGGRVIGDWPGLDEAALLDRRDLMPTQDVRAIAGWALRGLFGTERAAIEQVIFPGLDLGDDPRILL